jgi:hypothetical protein
LTILRLLAVAAVAALPAGAGELTITQKQTGGQGGTSTAYYGASAFKHADAQTESIFEYASGKLTVVEHGKKQYWEATSEDMKAASDAMAAKLAEVEKQLEQAKGNPMLEKMLKSVPGMGPAGAVKVTKTAETRKIAGYDCTKYVIAMGEALTLETWATTALKPPVPMFQARQAFAMANPMMQRYTKAFEEMSKIEGLSLAETTSFEMMGRRSTFANEAVEVKEGAIPASVFAPPAGYKRVESPLKKLAKELK